MARRYGAKKWRDVEVDSRPVDDGPRATSSATVPESRFVWSVVRDTYPVQEIGDHVMHSEEYEVSEQAAETVNAALGDERPGPL